MNILTLGGSGFVSGTFTRAARAAGHNVWALTRGKRKMPDGVRPIVADRKDRDAFALAIRGLDQHFDLVLDCIGYEPADAEQDLALFPGRADHLVFISTDFVYEPSRRQFPQPIENQHFISEGYGGKKRECELRLLGSDGKLPWTILRPCHIYGPGSQLGCLPKHSRDVELIARMRRGEPLTLVGAGHFLQQPILADDLAQLILSCHGNARCLGKIYHAAGPDIVESSEYYRIIAQILGVDVTINESPVQAYAAEKPEHRSFLCHRIYDLSGLKKDGLAAPSTPLKVGLKRQVESLLNALAT